MHIANQFGLKGLILSQGLSQVSSLSTQAGKAFGRTIKSLGSQAKSKFKANYSSAQKAANKLFGNQNQSASISDKDYANNNLSTEDTLKYMGL